MFELIEDVDAYLKAKVSAQGEAELERLANEQALADSSYNDPFASFGATTTANLGADSAAPASKGKGK